MTDDLISFLASWLHWAENGAPDGEPHNRRNGLCHNALRFEYSSWRARCQELADLLFEEFDQTINPFGDDYLGRSLSRTQHLCPNRLAWVRKKLGEVETYRGWSIGTCWFGYEATHPDYDPTPVYADDGPSDTRYVIANTRAGLIVEIDHYLEENEDA